MVEWLGDDIDIRILAADRDKGDQHPYPNAPTGVWHPVEKSKVRYLLPQEFNIRALRKILLQTAYDILYLNSVLAMPVLRVLLLRRLRLIPQRPAIVTPRGHLDQGALSLKHKKKRFFLSVVKLGGLFDGVTWHVTSEAERDDVLRELGSHHEPYIYVIPNLIAPVHNDLAQRPIDKHQGHLKLVFLSRISRKKGLDLILRSLDSIEGNIEFDIFGPMEDTAYWEKCQALITGLPNSIHVCYKGVVAPDQVIETLASYHLFVLPTLGENFGHVIAESLSAGCPVLISDRTPWNGVEAAGAGWVVPVDQQHIYAERIRTAVNMTMTEFRQMSGRACEFSTKGIDQERSIQATKDLFMNQVHR